MDLVFDDVRGTLGGLDVLINNAVCAGPTGPPWSLDAGLWERTLAVNLQRPVLFARRAVPHAERVPGQPLHHGHGSARIGTPWLPPCAHPTPSTKWAVVGLMQVAGDRASAR